MMRLRLTFGDWLRNALGSNVSPDPEPTELSDLALKHARLIVAEGIDLRHPSADVMLAWRIRNAILEDRETRGRP